MGATHELRIIPVDCPTCHVPAVWVTAYCSAGPPKQQQLPSGPIADVDAAMAPVRSLHRTNTIFVSDVYLYERYAKHRHRRQAAGNTASWREVLLQFMGSPATISMYVSKL